MYMYQKNNLNRGVWKCASAYLTHWNTSVNIKFYTYLKGFGVGILVTK